MADIDLARQLNAQLAGLAAAGVEWLPRVAMPQSMIETAAAESANCTDPLPDANSPERRLHELTVLAERVSRCVRCPELAATRSQTVFGVGPIGAEICFIGEAPGGDEDRQGEPFVGPAGQKLNQIIVGCGLRREDIYICNILRCRPPGNRPPLPDECANCREYLVDTLELVGPKVIVCWGGVAAQNLLKTTTSISRLRGKFHSYRDTPVLCTFHPSYLLRNPSARKDIWEDMQVLLKHLGRPIPGQKS
jgi:uracil-DNA glycosylase